MAVYEGKPLPQIPAADRSPVLERGAKQLLTPAALVYYSSAVRNYRRAVQLNPKSAIALLGLGYEYEEGLRAAPTLREAAQALGLPGKPEAEKVRKIALDSYRRAYAAAKMEDLAASHGFAAPVSQEAAEGVVRLQQGRKLTAGEKAELARLEVHIKTLAAQPRAITPILISFEGEERLQALLAPGSQARFDLAGDGGARSWPWVKPGTGILAWDPKHTGRITSGLQLFGSVTWWLFWKNGYAPLAALDEDHNGALEGPELNGIVVWFDRNSNGVSDPSEVVTLDTLGVTRIATRPQGRRDGVLWNATGVELRDGRSCATFDWEPASVQHPGQ